MVVTSEGIDPDAVTKRERVGSGIRSLIAGHPEGAVRRIVLYLVAFIALGFGDIASPVVAGALILLALTDQLA